VPVSFVKFFYSISCDINPLSTDISRKVLLSPPTSSRSARYRTRYKKHYLTIIDYFRIDDSTLEKYPYWLFLSLSKKKDYLKSLRIPSRINWNLETQSFKYSTFKSFFSLIRFIIHFYDFMAIFKRKNYYFRAVLNHTKE
jgi:hypothetical protein